MFAPNANVTRFENFQSAMEIDIKCLEASYDKVCIDYFIYKHKCFPAGWGEFFNNPEVTKAGISPLIEKEVKSVNIEPPMPHMFRAFTVSPDNIKAIIIGQDPASPTRQGNGPVILPNSRGRPPDCPKCIQRACRATIGRNVCEPHERRLITPWVPW